VTEDCHIDDFGTTERGLEIVRYMRPRCPKCGSMKIRSRRSINQGDGSMFRYSVCNECEENFVVVAE